ncbi:MAG: hypothetical protein ACXAC7_08650 [Candidatus Hodarchaeales archaeon]
MSEVEHSTEPLDNIKTKSDLSNSTLFLAFIFGLFFLLLPILTLVTLSGTSFLSSSEKDGFKEGLVFIAFTSFFFTILLGPVARTGIRGGFRTVGRGFLRSGFRSGVRTGVRTGMRTTLRSSVRTGVRTTVRSGVKPFFGFTINEKTSWLFQKIFPNPNTIKHQKILDELFRLVLTLLILILSFSIVASYKPPLSEATCNPDDELCAYEFVNWIIPDLGALIFILIILFLSEKIWVEFVEKEDYRFLLTPDGVIIQILFTMGLSFLPLVHDTDCSGSEKVRARMGLFGIISLLFTASCGFLANSIWFPIESNIFLTSVTDMAILFALIFSFPIQPYEGGEIYRWNKKIAFLLFGICIASTYFISPSLILLI